MHPNLKFEIEQPETTTIGLSLSLLDFKVTISKDATALLNSTKNQPINHYSSTVNQLFLPNPNSTSFATNENASRTNAPHVYQQHDT